MVEYLQQFYVRIETGQTLGQVSSLGKNIAVELYKVYATIQRARRVLSTSEYRLKRKLARASNEYREEVKAMLEIYYIVDYILERVETRLETIITTGTYTISEWLSDTFKMIRLLREFQQSIPTEVLDVIDEATSSMSKLLRDETPVIKYFQEETVRSSGLTTSEAKRVLEEAKEYARSKIKTLEANIG